MAKVKSGLFFVCLFDRQVWIEILFDFNIDNKSALCYNNKRREIVTKYKRGLCMTKREYSKDEFNYRFASDDDEEAQELFWDSIRRYPEKPFDLNKSNLELTTDITRRFMNGEFKSVNSFNNAVLKSFILADRYDDVLPYVYVADQRFKNSNVMTEFMLNFLNSIVPAEKRVFGEKPIAEKIALANIVVDKLEDTFGDNMFTDNLITAGSFRTEVVYPMLYEKGYKFYSPRKSNLLLREDTGTKKLATDQNFALEQFVNIVNKMIKHYDEVTSMTTKREEFDAYWNAVEKILNSLDEKMSEETKDCDAYKKALAEIYKFYNVDKIKFKNEGLKESKKGDYSVALADSLRNVRYKRYNEKDVEILKDFYARIKKLADVLTIKDKNGETYPANYFKVMPIGQIRQTIKCMEYLNEFAPEVPELGWTKNDADMLVKARTAINKNFPRDQLAFDDDFIINVDDYVSRAYKGRSFSRKNTKVDFSDPESFEKFVDEVKDVLKEQEFDVSYDNDPNPEVKARKICINVVCESLISGKYPVNIDAKNAEVEKSL